MGVREIVIHNGLSTVQNLSNCTTYTSRKIMIMEAIVRDKVRTPYIKELSDCSTYYDAINLFRAAPNILFY